MVSEESPRRGSNQANPLEIGQSTESLFSPRLKSVAAMAGWDEETLIFASLVVDDTPDRSSEHKKRSDSQFKTPPSTNSRRKRRAKPSSVLATVPIANLDEEENEKKETNKKKSTEIEAAKKEDKKTRGDKTAELNSGVSSLNHSLPCMDRLKEELSCAICLEICFEPSTTSCGHSFCKKCLRSAADKCGKRCPKCRQLISNGRSCTVNTVLWNTIQLLFPQEVEARKATAVDLSSKEKSPRHMERRTRFTERRTRGQTSGDEEDRFQREDFSRLVSIDWSNQNTRRLRRGTVSVPTQNEDAALALRLQREEFMEAFSDRSRRSSLSSARENLRAMASRAIQIRRRS